VDASIETVPPKNEVVFNSLNGLFFVFFC